MSNDNALIKTVSEPSAKDIQLILEDYLMRVVYYNDYDDKYGYICAYCRRWGVDEKNINHKENCLALKAENYLKKNKF